MCCVPIDSPMLMVLLRLRLGPGQRKSWSTIGTMARGAASAHRLLLSSLPFRAYLAQQRHQLQRLAFLRAAQTLLLASSRRLRGVGCAHHVETVMV